jgi:hypothetical protein
MALGFGTILIHGVLHLAGLVVLVACSLPPPPPARSSVAMSAVPQRDDTRVTIANIGATTTIDVYSESGIGSAEVSITSAALPEKIVMRLHLRGLEEFNFGYDSTRVTASLSSMGDGTVRESVTTTGDANDAQPIDASSPYWMDVQVVAADKTIPLKDGYIEVTAPKHFIDGGYRAFKIDWVDFFRS